MKIFEILPIKIAVFDCPDFLLKKYLQKAQDVLWKDCDSRDFYNFGGEAKMKNGYGWTALDNKECQDLFEWIDSCLEEIRKNFNLPFEKIKSTNAWINKQTNGGFHAPHDHPASILSGILYLTSQETGKTIFSNIDEWRNNIFIAGAFKRQMTAINSIAGKLVIFPSSLKHAVSSYKENKDRYTISFNSFPDGEVGTITQGLKISTSNLEKNSQQYIINIDNTNKILEVAL